MAHCILRGIALTHPQPKSSPRNSDGSPVGDGCWRALICFSNSDPYGSSSLDLNSFHTCRNSSINQPLVLPAVPRLRLRHAPIGEVRQLLVHRDAPLVPNGQWVLLLFSEEVSCDDVGAIG